MFRRLLVSAALSHSVTRSRKFPRVLRSLPRVNGLILLDSKLNDKPAVFLLDTGANNSVVDVHSAGFDGLRLDALRSTGSTGAEGACTVREVKLSLEHRSSLNRRVCVMDLSDVSRRMGVRVDGFIGADVLSEFSAVLVDFKNHRIRAVEVSGDAPLPLTANAPPNHVIKEAGMATGTLVSSAATTA